MIIEALLCFCATVCVQKVKPSALTLKPPLTDRGESIPTLRLPWLCYLKLEAVALTQRNVTSKASKHAHKHIQVINTKREISHAYEMGKYIPRREGETAKRGGPATRLLPSLMFESNGLTACYQCEGIWLSSFKCAMIYILFDDWHKLTHTLSHSLITALYRLTFGLAVPKLIQTKGTGLCVWHTGRKMNYTLKTGLGSSVFGCLNTAAEVYLSLFAFTSAASLQCLCEGPHYGTTSPGLH